MFLAKIENFLKKFFLLLIRFYQIVFSGFMSKINVQCKYYPSCSRYAQQALKHRNFLQALLLIVWRLLRCNPFSLGGVDELKPIQKNVIKEM